MPDGKGGCKVPAGMSSTSPCVQFSDCSFPGSFPWKQAGRVLCKTSPSSQLSQSSLLSLKFSTTSSSLLRVTHKYIHTYTQIHTYTPICTHIQYTYTLNVDNDGDILFTEIFLWAEHPRSITDCFRLSLTTGWGNRSHSHPLLELRVRSHYQWREKLESNTGHGTPGSRVPPKQLCYSPWELPAMPFFSKASPEEIGRFCMMLMGRLLHWELI